jgi:hypothetical protein
LLSDILADVFDGPRRIQFETHGAPYVRLGDLDAGEIYFDPCQTIAPLDLERRFYLRPGDVLVSKTGDEPRAVVTSGEAQGAVIAPDIYCLRIHPGGISPTWLAYFLNTRHGQHLLSERIAGATVRRLRMAELRSLPLLLPPLPLVQEIESLEQQAQANTQSAHELWAAILTGMYAEIDDRSGMTGKVEIAAVEDLLSTSGAQKIFRPLSEVARIAVSSRKTLKPDQLVSYVQASDIDPQSFLFRRVRNALAQDLPSRIRLPLQAYQVLLLASGSNLGTPTHPIAVVDAKLHGGFASNAFLALEFDETPIYYAIALKHPLVLAQLRHMAVGPVVSTLRKKDIVHLRIPQLSAVWRQDFNDRAQLAWERRTLALTLRRQALDKAEAFIAQALAGAGA